MPPFGRRQSVEEPVRWRGWPEKLDVTDTADVEWIKRSNDPLVWHAAALACLIFSGDEHGLLPWLARQPALDRVTGAAMFLHGDNGVLHLTGAARNIVRVEDVQVGEMIERLCEIDKAAVLADNGIGMDPDWEAARLTASVRLAGVPWAPMRLLSRPIDRQVASMPYADIGEGELVSVQYMRRWMPFLFD